MSTIAMNRVKEAMKTASQFVEMVGDFRDQLGELRTGISFGRKRSSPLSAAAWFSAGVVTGATAAVMFAPKSGDQVRQDIARTAEKLLEPIARKWRAAREGIASGTPRSGDRRVSSDVGNARSGTDVSSGVEERVHPIHS
jgi:gas vesicle protein